MPVRTYVHLLLAVLWGCSLIVQPGDDRCTGDEGCPTGQTCRDEVCVAAPPCASLDVCGNGVDDDCNGIIDDGPPEVCNSADDDCDGEVDEDIAGAFEICNAVDDDCDGSTDENLSAELDRCGNDFDEDCDTNIDEGEPEVCDNIDNDCDANIDEGAPCEAGTSCFFGRCEAPSCLNGGFTCDGDQFCDVSSSPALCQRRTGAVCENDAGCSATQRCALSLGGVCVEAADIGEPCMGDFSCRDGFCADLAAVGRSGSICSVTCCSDAACADGTRCTTALLGGNLCVPNAMAGAPTGATCSASEDCASGICRSGTCAAMCGADSRCAGSDVCAGISAADSRASFTCGASGRNDLRSFEDCGVYVFGTLVGLDPGRCRNRQCVSLGSRAVCVEPCESSADCPTGACGFFPTAPRSVANVCLPDSEGSRRAGGAECTTSEQCKSLECVAGACRDGCCRTDQCPNGSECRTVLRGGAWPMICLDRSVR